MDFEHKTNNPDLTLRDLLALERTKQSGRRTLLAYLRTAMAFLTAGVGLAKFFYGGVYRAISVVLIAAAPVFIILGFWNLYKTESRWHFLKR